MAILTPGIRLAALGRTSLEYLASGITVTPLKHCTNQVCFPRGPRLFSLNGTQRHLLCTIYSADQIRASTRVGIKR